MTITKKNKVKDSYDFYKKTHWFHAYLFFYIPVACVNLSMYISFVDIGVVEVARGTKPTAVAAGKVVIKGTNAYI